MQEDRIRTDSLSVIPLHFAKEFRRHAGAPGRETPALPGCRRWRLAADILKSTRAFGEYCPAAGSRERRIAEGGCPELRVRLTEIIARQDLPAGRLFDRRSGMFLLRIPAPGRA
jgi:hypothetical protein